MVGFLKPKMNLACSILFVKSASTKAGFAIKAAGLVDEKFKCLICRLILKRPMVLVCGHHICFGCIAIDRNVHCPKCHEITLASQIQQDNDFESEIYELHSSCYLCEWLGVLKDYQTHLEKVHEIYECLHCCETFDSAVTLNQHKENVCPNVIINCILQPFGCKEQDSFCVAKHLNIISITTISGQSHYEDTLDKDLQSLDTTIPSVTTASSSADQQMCVTGTIIDIADSVRVLNRGLEKLNDQFLQQSQSIETTGQYLQVLNALHGESNESVKTHSTTMGILQQESSELKQQLAEYQSTSYDGTFLWKLTDIGQKMTEARTKHKISIYSSAFYSSPTGYKTCARLYPYGDENTFGTHMSISFVVMRSTNDPVLFYPFNYEVTFCLLDQTDQQRHIIRTIRPDEQSNCSQRPQLDMNTPTEIPDFVPLYIFEQVNNPYVRNNTMFIRILIDFENLPKTLLPYVMSLNPGLPPHTRQKLIQQEMERHQRVSQAEDASTSRQN
ncbi:unnamed protein product [Adineta ricciae]|uniref:Uncharacterized protein n=1 Tax=Adineta ricciae TaxID=249248 RepID=A0A814GVD2_ADIRI|nr:unnamed protein product [Adineta ricciae]